jgi:predicted DNA repair protein MutK
MPSGFFAILDDVAVATKVATRKTAAILGDDLAVNAEKATGFLSSREIPVLWAITKGSFINKIIIVPLALLLNVFFPAAIKIILILGGFYLAYEGAEKIIEYLFHRKEKVHSVLAQDTVQDEMVAEKAKVKSAITTDFILSIEIVILALYAAKEMTQDLVTQIITVSVVAIVATVGVYGLVALIVRMDDYGYRLIKKSNGKGFFASLGEGLVKSLPVVIKILSVVGTIALLMVSGGIFVHNIDYLHHFLPTVPSIIKEMGIGLIVGVLVVGVVTLVKKILPAPKAAV